MPTISRLANCVTDLIGSEDAVAEETALLNDYSCGFDSHNISLTLFGRIGTRRREITTEMWELHDLHNYRGHQVLEIGKWGNIYNCYSDVRWLVSEFLCYMYTFSHVKYVFYLIVYLPTLFCETKCYVFPFCDDVVTTDRVYLVNLQCDIRIILLFRPCSLISILPNQWIIAKNCILFFVFTMCNTFRLTLLRSSII